MLNYIQSLKISFTQEKNNFERVKKVNQILSELSISKEEYEQVLSTSDDHDFQIHTRMPQNLCFINSYFADGLLTWKVNMDIQAIFD